MQRILSRCGALTNTKLFNPLARPFSSAASSVVEGTSKTASNTKNIFADDSNWLLINKYLVYQLCRFPFFVKNARKMVAGANKIFGIFLIILCNIGTKFVNFCIEQTIGKVFTAGITLDDLSKDMEALVAKKVYSVADLSIEDVGNAPREVLFFSYKILFSIWTKTQRTMWIF